MNEIYKKYQDYADIRNDALFAFHDMEDIFLPLLNYYNKTGKFNVKYKYRYKEEFDERSKLNNPVWIPRINYHSLYINYETKVYSMEIMLEHHENHFIIKHKFLFHITPKMWEDWQEIQQTEKFKKGQI